MSASTFTIKAGDTRPLAFTLLVDDVPVDLTGATVVLTLRRRRTTTLVITEQPVTVLAPTTAGTCSFAWPAGTTVTPMDVEIEVKVTFADGTVLTFPNDSNAQGVIVPRITP